MSVDSIQASGGDHVSPFAWEEATDNDLVTATESETGELAAETFTNSPCTMNDATTDATYNRTLTIQAGAEYDPSDDTGAKLVYSSGGTIALRDHYDSFIGPLKIEWSVDSGNSCVNGFTGNFLVDKIFIEGMGGTQGSGGYAFINETGSSGTCWFRNCMAWANTSSVMEFGIYAAEAAVNTYNCAAYNCPEVGIRIFVGDAQNCWSSDCGTDFHFNYGGSGSTNAAEDGSGDITMSATIGDEITDVANDDFSIVDSGSVLDGAGADLSGTFTDDIFGTTRSAWDIGPIFFDAGGAAPVPTLSLLGVGT